MPPISGPDAVQLPAEAFEDELAELVTIAGGGCAMIGCAVAFDTKQVAPRSGRINDTKVDAVARASHLVVDLVTRLADIIHHSLNSMNYDVLLAWTTVRPHLSFDPIAVERSPVNRYEEIRRRHLVEHGVLLPVPSHSEWACPVSYEDELSLQVTLFSELGEEALQKQLERALVPEFTDRVQVQPSRSDALGVVCSN